MLPKIPKREYLPKSFLPHQSVVSKNMWKRCQHPSKSNSLKSNHNFQKAKKSKVECGEKRYWMTWPGGENMQKKPAECSHEKILETQICRSDLP